MSIEITEELIHQILLRAISEVRDVLLETNSNLEIAQLLDVHITISEPAQHDELENHIPEEVVSWS